MLTGAVFMVNGIFMSTESLAPRVDTVLLVCSATKPIGLSPSHPLMTALSNPLATSSSSHPLFLSSSHALILSL